MFVSGCSVLLVVRGSLFHLRCSLLVADRSSSVVLCGLLIVVGLCNECSKLIVVTCLLSVVCCMLFVLSCTDVVTDCGCCLMRIVGYLRVVCCCLLCDVCCCLSLFVVALLLFVCCLLFAVRCL